MVEAATSIRAESARRIKLLALDVDGVLTDGGIYLGATESGERIEMKRFEITDGLGVRLLKDSGIQVAIITGRESSAVALRAAELGVEECHQDAAAAKLPIMESLLKRLGIDWDDAAFMGDDLADLPVLRRVGFPVAVANAVAEVRAEAAWVGTKKGGDGAVRELAEAILRARGEWASSVDSYVKGREEAG